MNCCRGGLGNWFYRFNVIGSPLPVSCGETGEMSCERAGWEIDSTDLMLSTARFQFRLAKLARRAVCERTGEIGFADLMLSAVRFQFREAKLARRAVNERTGKLVLQI